MGSPKSESASLTVCPRLHELLQGYGGESLVRDRPGSRSNNELGSAGIEIHREAGLSAGSRLRLVSPARIVPAPLSLGATAVAPPHCHPGRRSVGRSGIQAARPNVIPSSLSCHDFGWQHSWVAVWRLGYPAGLTYDEASQATYEPVPMMPSVRAMGWTPLSLSTLTRLPHRPRTSRYSAGTHSPRANGRPLVGTSVSSDSTRR